MLEAAGEIAMRARLISWKPELNATSDEHAEVEARVMQALREALPHPCFERRQPAFSAKDLRPVLHLVRLNMDE
jgi:hypothetical protein